jgi:hypothetical protein
MSLNNRPNAYRLMVAVKYGVKITLPVPDIGRLI